MLPLRSEVSRDFAREHLKVTLALHTCVYGAG